MSMADPEFARMASYHETVARIEGDEVRALIA